MVSRGGWLALVATSLMAVGPTYAGVGAQSAVTVAPGALAGILTGTASGLIRRDRWRPASRAVSMTLGPGMGGMALRGHVRLGRSEAHARDWPIVAAHR